MLKILDLMQIKLKKALILGFLALALIFLHVFAKQVSFLFYGESNYNKALRASSFEVSFLDVAQGDAIFVRLPDGVTVLIDTGSAKRELQYIDALKLKLKKSEQIDYLILSHGDSDHALEVDNIVEDINIECLKLNLGSINSFVCVASLSNNIKKGSFVYSIIS